MTPLPLIAWLLFLLGNGLRFYHLPFASLLTILGPLMLSVHALVFALAKFRSEPVKAMFYLACSLSAVYILFRIMYWPAPQMPFLGVSIPFVLAVVSALAFIILVAVRKAKFGLKGLFVLSLFVATVLLSVTPAYRVCAIMDVHTWNPEKEFAGSYLRWDKYSWFLYIAGEHQKATEANREAQRRVQEAINLGGDEKAVYYAPTIHHHGTLIQTKRWVKFPQGKDDE